MAGRGPAPKPKGSRARRNKDPQVLRIITAQPVEQPSLPVIEQVVLDENGKPRKKRFTWPTVTRRWWKMWGESPAQRGVHGNRLVIPARHRIPARPVLEGRLSSCRRTEAARR